MILVMTIVPIYSSLMLYITRGAQSSVGVLPDSAFSASGHSPIVLITSGGASESASSKSTLKQQDNTYHNYCQYIGVEVDA